MNNKSTDVNIHEIMKKADKALKEIGAIPSKMHTYDPSCATESLAPLVPENMEILVLGTMPGNQSLQKQEYYANPSNRFWKIIAKANNADYPQTYDDKKMLLSNLKIGLWDMLKSAERKGSLDRNIHNEEINDIDTFIKEHPTIKKVIFNGKKAAEYTTCISSKIDIIVLPSTSSANTSLTADALYDQWITALTTK